jgi:hypothetical protein
MGKEIVGMPPADLTLLLPSFATHVEDCHASNFAGGLVHDRAGGCVVSLAACLSAELFF